MPKKTVKTGKKAAKKKMVKKAVKKVEPKKSVPNMRLPEIKSPFGKSQISGVIAGMTGLTKKNAKHVIDVLFEVVAGHLKKRGPGEFTLPGIAKFKVVRKPATKARKGINPFTGEPAVFAAKPARNVVKIKPLKRLKDSAK